MPLLLVGVLAGCSASDSGGSEAASDAGAPMQDAPQAAEVGERAAVGEAGAEGAAEDSKWYFSRARMRLGQLQDKIVEVMENNKR